MKTTKDPLAELVDAIERKISEVRASQQRHEDSNPIYGKLCEAQLIALVELRDAHDRRMIEAAERGETLDGGSLQRAGSVALCEWQKKLPDESGLWWWWNEDEDSLPIVVDIAYSGTDGCYFAMQGQHGWTRFQRVSDMGGWWWRLPEPERPQN